MSSELKSTSKYAVDTVKREHEYAWGAKIEDTEYFDSLLEASAFSREYNLKHYLDTLVADAPRSLTRIELAQQEKP